MKILRIIQLSFLAFCAGTGVLAAQTPAPYKYVNSQELRIINKGFDDTERHYSRLPLWMKANARPGLWDRQECSSGIAVRFATDSRRIGVKYDLLWDTHMIHMADTGLKGADLYRLGDDGSWLYVNTVRPYTDNGTKTVTKDFVENMDGDMHEYLVYFPLYDGVIDFNIGVDSAAVIQKPIIDNPRSNRKIVMYGTSILQGGCSTRTGMCSTNMLQRDLNCEVVNLGFSGEGKMDMDIAKALAQIENVDAYVLDPIPNCTEMMCDTITYGFVNYLRQARPEVPIVMVETEIYPYAKFNSYFEKYLPAKNAAFRKNYEKMKAENPNNLYYVDCEGLIDDEGTVDGIHLTDVGFRAYADKLYPVLLQFVSK